MDAFIWMMLLPSKEIRNMEVSTSKKEGFMATGIGR